jgi:hypothetical protein
VQGVRQNVMTNGGAPMASTVQQGFATRQASSLGNAPTMTGARQGVAEIAAAPTASAAYEDPSGVQRVTADQVQASQWDQATADRYANPYYGAVRDNTAREMGRQQAVERASMNDGAQAAGAFGGTRHALLESETRRNQGETMLDYLDRANAAGYENAQGQFERDRTADMSAQGMNQSANLNAGQFNSSLLDALSGRNADRQQQVNVGNADRAGTFSLADFDARNRAFAGDADRDQQARGANMDAAMRYAMANQGAENDARGSNQAAMNTAFGADAGRAQQTNFANQDASSRFRLADQDAFNSAYGADAGRAQQAGLSNQDFLSRFMLSDQDAANTAIGANANRSQDAARFNATAANDINTSNADRTLTADRYNGDQTADLYRRLMAGGEQMAGFGGQQQQQQTQDIMNLMRAGGLEQDTNQAGMDAAYQEFLRMQDAPMDRYRDLMGILSGTPRNTTTNTTGSGTSTQKQQGSIWDTLIGAGQIAASFSDRRLKRGVSFIRRLANGLGVYRYRYVWDAPGVKRLGVMAQEVAVRRPDALGPRVHGYLTVNYAKLGEAA